MGEFVIVRGSENAMIMAISMRIIILNFVWVYLRKCMVYVVRLLLSEVQIILMNECEKC